MTNTDLIPIREQLNRIEKKLENKLSKRYLDIQKVAEMLSISVSSIRRRVRSGELKCCRKLGKLLFKEADIWKWLND